MYSIFDIFKVSIGPSSSHTMGPMIAGKHFRDLLAEKKLDVKVDKVNAKLFGSLAFTGKAHGSEKGIALGLSGFSPEIINTRQIKQTVSKIKKTSLLNISDKNKIPFTFESNILFDAKTPPKGHSNTLEIIAYSDNEEMIKKTYHSVGGGFVRVKGERKRFALPQKSPYEFDSCDELMTLCKKSKLNIDELTMKNEMESLSKTELRKRILAIWNVMNECIENEHGEGREK